MADAMIAADLPPQSVIWTPPKPGIVRPLESWLEPGLILPIEVREAVEREAEHFGLVPMGFIGGRRKVFSTDFGGYALDQQPNDWSLRWGHGAGSIIVRSAGGSRSGKVLRFNQTASGRRFYSWDRVPVSGAMQILARFRSLEYPPSGVEGVSQAGVVTRGDGGDTGYTFAAHYDRRYNTDWYAHIGILLSNSPTSLTSGVEAPGPVYWTNTWKYIRVHTEGGWHGMKLWDAGQAEPDAWLAAVDNGTIGQGRPGVYNISHYTANREFDWFAVGLDGKWAPMP